MKPPIAELERRRPVWDVMSEFFLDTQLLADDHARIARRLDESGYALAELEQILWHEVSPALWWNLTSVAGECWFFDMAAVERQILEQPAGALRRWLTYRAGGLVARHAWQCVRPLLKRGRAV